MVLRKLETKDLLLLEDRDEMGLNVGPESGLLRQLHLGRQRKRRINSGRVTEEGQLEWSRTMENIENWALRAKAY